MSTTPTAEQQPNPELKAEVAALRASVARLEGRVEQPSKRLDIADWKMAVAAQQTQRVLESRARARAGAEARESVLDATRKERESLEARLQKVNADRSSRLAQHQRAEAKIRFEFAEQEREATAALAELRDRIDAEVKAAEAAPVKVIVPPVRLGIDQSYMAEIAHRPTRMPDGTMRDPVTGEKVGRWQAGR